ncbi:MAG: DUF1491 family protein [Sphingomonas sp.]|uniref:DUF1491 family protein n=1 Tax=Sphingomonas sp. TaxID=28214 RepID=UPI0035A87E12|nr:DUF1491 family protein [Sphingomonas sp.]
MSDRLPSATVVGALLRRVNDAGGLAMVLAKGDQQAGAILVVTCNKGRQFNILERTMGPTGTARLMPVGVAGADGSTDDSQAIGAYWQRRRARDPDLWVIELDIPDAERFAAETIGLG